MHTATTTSQQEPSPSADKPLVFLHVPKTAGTTLWLILRRQHSPRGVIRVDHDDALAAIDAAQWDQTRVLLGHLAFGVHGFRRPPTYVTILREPLERTLSHYGHWARDHKDSLSLGEYLRSGTPGVDNIQTRMLAGPEAEALPSGACDRDVFELARRNMVENIAVTGLTERFDETLLLLQQRFGWNLPCYVAENVGANRIRRDDVPRDVLKQIWDMTRWDRELYALAAERLEAEITRQGPEFAASVRRFRIANVRYRRMRGLVSGPLQALKGRLALEKQMGLETAVRSLLAATQWHGGQHGTPAGRPAGHHSFLKLHR